jgi:hypothetical protein
MPCAPSCCVCVPGRRQLVFAAVRGEPWGYLGSRRLLWDLHRLAASAGQDPSTAFVAGLRLESIKEVSARVWFNDALDRVVLGLLAISSGGIKVNACAGLNTH